MEFSKVAARTARSILALIDAPLTSIRSRPRNTGASGLRFTAPFTRTRPERIRPCACEREQTAQLRQCSRQPYRSQFPSLLTTRELLQFRVVRDERRRRLHFSGFDHGHELQRIDRGFPQIMIVGHDVGGFRFSRHFQRPIFPLR